ncbi:MAG: alkaline phosphatase family protein [Actinomycetota bacterium]|nr:alkaline phosphatase family protein [Actinomycetota bacterium]
MGHGPQRRGGQGLDAEQEESGNRAIMTLLTGATGEQVDLVLTWRPFPTVDGRAAADDGGAYEVWAARGMVRFRRLLAGDGSLHYEVVEVVGRNPIADDDPLALTTIAAERAAAAAGGFDPDDPARRFIAPEQQSYPFGYERVAQLFDSPNAPDLAVSPRDWCSGSQPGTHGALHVRQARAPLWLSGPGVLVGRHELALRATDIAPTCLAALGFPFVDGADASGRTSSERGVAPDVLLARQDGRVAHELLDSAGASPQPSRLYVFLLDGMHQTELQHQLERDPSSLPHLHRLQQRAAVVAGGSIVNFPSITWPSHTTIVTGSWCGHHGVVNPSYYLRDERRMVSPQGVQMGTEVFASTAVESLYEAFHRQHPGCVTAAIHAPFGRSARHAVLEGRNLCDRATVKSLTAELAADINPRWQHEHASVAGEAMLDTRGLAQVIELFTRTDQPPPDFVYHELALTDGAGHEYGPHGDGLVAALVETDRRIGRVLAVLDDHGLFDDTLFVVTADHGMAPQATELRANPTAHVPAAGLAAEIAEPMIWLRDLAVVVERAPDGRTGRVIVADNDTGIHTGNDTGYHTGYDTGDDTANDTGNDTAKPPFAGAEVVVEHHGDGAPRVLAAGLTDDNGRFGFATPSDVDSCRIGVVVRATGRNPRHLLLDGTRLVLDLRAALYGPQR